MKYSETARIILAVVIFVILVLVFRVRNIPIMLFELAVSFIASYLIFWLLDRFRKSS